MGVYKDYPKRYPKRKDLFEGDGVNSKYKESKIPVPRPPVYKKSVPVSELGKDPLPIIASAKPSRIPTPKRLSFVENNGKVLSSLSSNTLVNESTPKRIPIEENNEEEGQVPSKLSSNTTLIESVAPSTGGNSSKPSAPSDSFTREKINVAAVITSFDALCNSSTVPLQHATVPLKPIGSITKTLFADAIPAANISGNVERIVKEINNAVPLLENISKIKEQKLEAAPAAQAAEASPATSSTALSMSCSSSTSTSSLSASSEMTSTTDTSTENEITLLTEALTSGRGDGGMVQVSETTYYPSETTYFPSTAQSSRSSLSTIPEEKEDAEEEFCYENEEDSSSPDDNALPEPKKDKILVEISKPQLIEVIEWIEEERTRIKAKIHRLKTTPVKKYTCLQLARQGVFNRCMDTINWAKVTFNQFF